MPELIVYANKVTWEREPTIWLNNWSFWGQLDLEKSESQTEIQQPGIHNETWTKFLDIETHGSY